MSLGGSIDSISPVSGGCIARAARVVSGGKSFFIKWGDADVSETFGAEARGLVELERPAALIKIPGVIEEIKLEGGRGALMLEWIEKGSARSATWSRLGEGLAEIHRFSADNYGFEEDNYIGSSVQINASTNDWIDFFREHRLEHQVRLAESRRRWRKEWTASIDRLYARLGDLLPATPYVSLVHGDLWTGNVLADATGNPVLIDPAVHYGHREVDLAMSRLFGSFDSAFYDAYSSNWPLEAGHEGRVQVYNLYHLINHLNLFGESYAGEIDRLLTRY